MYTRLVSFLIRNSFFHETQFGFRPNHSTSHATTLLIEKITEAFEAKQAMVGVFLHLSKAFDTIDHDILLSKLFHYGIQVVPYDWFKSYLTNRQQQVMCQNVLSNVKYINFGVPHGSILGPLLFLIYVNDFPQYITKGKTIMFANDTNLFFTEKCHNSVFKEENEVLKHVDNWLLSNKLSLNINKTSYIVLRTPNTPLPVSNNLYLHGKALNRVESLRLSWKSSS